MIGLFDQAKKLHGTSADEFDDFDDEFSGDDETTDDEMTNRPRNVDDLADNISMSCDIDDDDDAAVSTTSASRRDRRSSTTRLRTLVFSSRAKNDLLKV